MLPAFAAGAETPASLQLPFASWRNATSQVVCLEKGAVPVLATCAVSRGLTVFVCSTKRSMGNYQTSERPIELAGLTQPAAAVFSIASLVDGPERLEILLGL